MENSHFDMKTIQTIVSSTYKMLEPYQLHRMNFECIFQEKMCNFPIAQFIADGLILRPSYIVQAFREASSTVSQEMLDEGMRSSDLSMVRVASTVWNDTIDKLSSPTAQSPKSRAVNVVNRPKPQSVKSSVQQQPPETKSTQQVQPKVVRPLPPAPPRDVVIQQLKARLEVDTPIYPSTEQTNRCDKVGCSYCLKLYHHMPLSPCIDRCGDGCIEAKWFPHMPPRAWFAIAKHHSANHEVKISPEPKHGQIPNPLYPGSRLTPAMDDMNIDSTPSTSVASTNDTQSDWAEEGRTEIEDRLSSSQNTKRVINLSRSKRATLPRTAKILRSGDKPY